jgi:simple sugar transport system ATP-binding protein
MTGNAQTTVVGEQQTSEDPDAVLQVIDITKSFGNVRALVGVSVGVRPGEVHCLLGDNGAGKSTLIKCLSGVHPPDSGQFIVDGKETRFTSPKDARTAGIATVFQDLAMIPLLSITRNFFLGSEPTKGAGPFQRFDLKTADRIVREELDKMGIKIRSTSQPVGTLSGGERQSVAIARAVYFGARVLILDEPTSALGVKQAGVVLKYILAARARGCAVIFITHNPHHAYPVGDRFTILNRGRSLGTWWKDSISREELVGLMAGGRELSDLEHELGQYAAELDGAKAATGGGGARTAGAATDGSPEEASSGA